jgi:hypothetical protein
MAGDRGGSKVLLSLRERSDISLQRDEYVRL